MAVYRCRTGPLLIGFSSSDSHMCMSVLLKARADHVFVCLFVYLLVGRFYIALKQTHCARV